MGYRPGRTRLPRHHPVGHQGNDGLTLQNRVLPTGEIVATPERGTLMGNRGILHDAAKTLTTRHWQHQAWVTCLLDFKNRRRVLMSPNRYTELFFLDEPAALAAGHRPCGECRRAKFAHFKSLFSTANGTDTLGQLDRLMHRHRVTRTRQQIRYQAKAQTLPDGAFILLADQPHLIWGDHVHRYSPSGYTASQHRPKGAVTVLTPACTVATLSAGYRPRPHASLGAP